MPSVSEESGFSLAAPPGVTGAELGRFVIAVLEEDFGATVVDARTMEDGTLEFTLQLPPPDADG